jgi:hypothetical protein
MATTSHGGGGGAPDGLMSRLVLPAEVLFIGVLVCLASLPVVTSLAAAGAGSTLLRELVAEERTPTVRRFARLTGESLRQPAALAAPLAALAVGVLDALALMAGLPGGRVLGPAVGAGLAGLLVTGLRAAACRRPGGSWRTALAEAAPRAAADWPGSLLLVGALVVVGVVAVRVPAFTVVLPGLLVMAAVAVEHRRRKGAAVCPCRGGLAGADVGGSRVRYGRRRRRSSALHGTGQAADDPLLEDREEDQCGQHGQ